jgi:hypothetical protein
MIFWEIYGK